MPDSPKFVSISKTCIVNVSNIVAFGYFKEGKGDPAEVIVLGMPERLPIHQDYVRSFADAVGVGQLLVEGDDGQLMFNSED